jgi:competence protein ComEC
MVYNPVYFFIFSFAVGLLVETYRDVSHVWLGVLLGLSFVVILLAHIFKKHKRTLLLFVVASIALIFGTLRMEIAENNIIKPFENEIGENVDFTGVIVDEVENRESNQRFVLEESETRSKILITTDLFPKYKYGDLVEVSGKLKTPENFTTDQGREFDYVSYLGKDGIFYTISFADISLLGHEAPSKVQEILFTFKSKLVENIGDVIPKPESIFMEGIALGGRSGMPSSLREEFVVTGTIHVIALSGYNITVVADGVQRILSNFLSRYVSLGFGGVAVVLFVLMTGAHATAVRAGIMALLAVLARATGRENDISRALFLAGFFMILHNPYILAHDVSFQLSFIATLGIIYITPITERWFSFIKNRWLQWFREIISTTLAAQIAVLPFIMYTMGSLSLISLPINILILPFIPLAMFIGFIVGIFGFVGTWLSLPFGFVGAKLLEGILSIIHLGANTPHASITVQEFPVWVLVLVYCFICWRMYVWYKKRINLNN